MIGDDTISKTTGVTLDPPIYTYVNAQTAVKKVTDESQTPRIGQNPANIEGRYQISAVEGTTFVGNFNRLCNIWWSIQ